jgi:hypothetical protein
LSNDRLKNESRNRHYRFIESFSDDRCPALPVRVLKIGLLRIFELLSLFLDVEIPLFSSTLKGRSKCLHFFGAGNVFFYVRQAGAYSPFAGAPSLEHKHETCSHTQILSNIQPPIGPLGWGLLQGLQVWNPNMKHGRTQILTAIQPPIGPLEVISGSRQT